jgi:hypothetical protein
MTVMGPFSNNNNPPQPPPGPSRSNKLPVPDVNGTPQTVIIAPAADNEGFKKWLNITLAIAGGMAIVGVLIFGIYVYVSNTPGYMLSAAFQNFVNGDGQAGTFSIQPHGTAKAFTGDFIGYSDPTNPHAGTLTVNAGQDASRVSAQLRLFTDSNFVQTAGLGNLGKLISMLHGDASAFTADTAVRLSSLEGQWYTVTSDDIAETQDVLPQHTLQSGPTSSDVETIEQLYLKHQFIAATQSLSDEHINNINTMHLKVTIDAAKLNDFLQAVKTATIKSLQLTDSDIQNIEKSTIIRDATIEAWINRSDRTFEQLRLTRPTDISTITFHSEEVATQRQTIIRPTAAKSFGDAIHNLRDILTAKPATK